MSAARDIRGEVEGLRKWDECDPGHMLTSAWRDSVASSLGQMAVDTANHKRAEAKASRERWEALMQQAKEDRVKP